MSKFLFESAIGSLIEQSSPEEFLGAYMKINTTLEEDSRVVSIFLKEAVSLNEADRISDEVKQRLTSDASGATKGLASNDNLLKEKSKAIIKLVNTAISLKADNIANSTFKHKALRIAIAAFTILGSILIPSSIIIKLVVSLTASIGVSIYSITRAKKEIDVIDSQISYVSEKLENIEDSRKKYELNKLLNDLKNQQKLGEKKLDRLNAIKEKSKDYASYKKDQHLENSEYKKDKRRENSEYRKEARRAKSQSRKAARRADLSTNEYGVNFS